MRLSTLDAFEKSITEVLTVSQTLTFVALNDCRASVGFNDDFKAEQTGLRIYIYWISGTFFRETRDSLNRISSPSILLRPVICTMLCTGNSRSCNS